MPNLKRKHIQTFSLALSTVFFIIYLYFEFILNGTVSGLLRLFSLLAGCFFLGIYSYSKYNKITTKTYVCFFIVYVAFLLNLTLFDSLYGRHISALPFKSMSEIKYYLHEKTNIIPFSTLKLYINGYANSYVDLPNMITNLFGNLIAFMPFGFFLPLFSEKLRKPWIFLLTVVAIILFIESAQLILMTGAFDVDDILLNGAGSMLAFWISGKYILKYKK